MQVLVVEDDPVIGRALRQGFAEAGIDCTAVAEGEAGLGQALSGHFDAIVLDLLLPGKHGLDVLADLRAAGAQVPVLVLTALGATEERVRGLRTGADDYLVKPFDFAELLARLQAICRRAVTRPSPVLRAGDLHLDLVNQRVMRAGKEIVVTPTEFSLLEYLMRYGGQVVTRKMLCEHLWSADWEGSTNIIEVHVNRLRGKLDRGFDNSVIRTIRGRGYAVAAG